MTCGCGVYAGKKLPPPVELAKRATIAAWIGFPLYYLWPTITHWLLFCIFGLDPNTPINASVGHFVTHFGSGFVIVLSILYVMNFIRIDPLFEKNFLWLSTKGRPLSYLLVIVLGLVTPSGLLYVIAIFLTLTQVRLNHGIVITYLIAGLCCNDVTLSICFDTLDWSLSVSLMCAASIVAFSVGMIIDKIRTKEAFSESNTANHNDGVCQCTFNSYRIAWIDTCKSMPILISALIGLVTVSAYLKGYCLVNPF